MRLAIRIAILRLAAMLLSAALCLAGCGNSRDIQSLAYATAIAMDYKNGKYVGYIQVLNFSNVARTENVELGKPVPIWVGKGDGETIPGALFETNATAQSPIFWGHVRTVILSENIMKRGVKDFFEVLNRHREARYNFLVYGTREKIEDILVQKSMFNLSPLDTMMFTAFQMNTQKSFILPMTSREVWSYMNEPGNIGMIPEIGIDRKLWKEDRSPKSMFMINGAYFFKDYAMTARMRMDDLKGIRWRNAKLDLTPVKIPYRGQATGVLMLSHPKFVMKIAEVGGEPLYDVAVECSGYVVDMNANLSIRAMERQAEEVIKEEIMATHMKAVAMKTDPYHFQLELYRRHPGQYMKLLGKSDYFLNEKSIRSIRARVHLDSTQKSKGRSL